MAKKANEKTIQRHQKILAQFNKLNAEAGWFENDLYPSGELISEIMKIQEYGTPRIPARPFMRLAHELFAQKRSSVEKDIITKMLDGFLTPHQAMKRIGLEMEESLRDSILNGGWAPNAPATIKRKGSDQPLIDSRTALVYVTSRVI